MQLLNLFTLGLLAGLWEFPSKQLPQTNDSTKASRKEDACSFVTDLLASDMQTNQLYDYIGELGSVPWVFSHLKLTMHVHAFVCKTTSPHRNEKEDVNKRWASRPDVERESMGTGMRKCWKMVKDTTDFVKS